MELEPSLLLLIASNSLWLHYSYMELEREILRLSLFVDVKNYIIPIWNWSSFCFKCLPLSINYYIIPIWNWSSVTSWYSVSNFFDYIIPIWNWSLYLLSLIFVSFFITLFLYGIGASLNQLLGLQWRNHYIIPIWNWS